MDENIPSSILFYLGKRTSPSLLAGDTLVEEAQGQRNRKHIQPYDHAQHFDDNVLSCCLWLRCPPLAIPG